MPKSTKPADAHLPDQLRPDPLTAGETSTSVNQNFREVDPAELEQDPIKNTELYRRLQEGLSNFEKLVQGETFKREIQRSGGDLRKYSSHLGRAEYGELKKRSSLGNLVTSGPGGVTLGRGGSPASYPMKPGRGSLILE